MNLQSLSTNQTFEIIQIKQNLNKSAMAVHGRGLASSGEPTASQP
jgi:hypothetical protein